MSDVSELAREFGSRGSTPATWADLARVLAALGQVGDASRSTRQFVNALEDRLMIVDDLPLEAPLGALIRRRNGTVAERATVYTGNGPGKPLARLVPTPLP